MAFFQFKSPLPYFIENLFMKYQPPFIRNDAALFTTMWISLLVVFEDIFFAGKLYNQIQCMLQACSLLDCQELSICFVLVVCSLAMEASLIWNLMLAGRSGENLLYFKSRIIFVCELFEGVSLKSLVDSSLKHLCLKRVCVYS